MLDLDPIKTAMEAFDKGLLVAVPTETVYGLAAPIDRQDLIERIFALKKRPHSDPLILHVASLAMAQSYVKAWPATAQSLALCFWPGPLTLLLEKNTQVPDLVTAGSPYVALRMPRHPLTLALIEKLGLALVAPSANLFQRVSPTRPEHVRKYFSEQDVLILPGAQAEVGIESTIVKLEDKKLSIVRQGMIAMEDLKAALALQDVEITVQAGADKAAPGQLKVHYQPAIPLVLSYQDVDLAQAKGLLEQQGLSVNRGVKIELNESAQQSARALYASLHAAEQEGDFLLVVVSAQTYGDQGQWQAIFDRLERAAHIVVRELLT